VSAQAALSALDRPRTQSLDVLTDSERLTIDRAAKGLPAYPLLDSVRDAAEAQLASQLALIQSLQAQLAAA